MYIYTDREVRDFDLLAVKHSDVVIVNFLTGNSIGTAVEVNMAEAWNIPVLGIGDPREVHPWMAIPALKSVEDLEEAFDYIVEFLARVL